MPKSAARISKQVKTLLPLIVIVFLALAINPVGFRGQDRSSIAIPKAKQPCDKRVQRRLALVIGNGAYPSKPLRNPTNDATAVAEELRKLGFAVTMGLNESQSEMEQMIRAFGDLLKSG